MNIEIKFIIYEFLMRRSSYLERYYHGVYLPFFGRLRTSRRVETLHAEKKIYYKEDYSFVPQCMIVLMTI